MTGRPLVLVVDDNSINIELVSFVLSAGGFELTTAADAPAAIAQIQARKPDLILMDIQLPGMDGVTLTRQLKADPGMRQTVIVAFTAYAMKDDRARLLAAGFDAYLPKPINVATFAEQVRRCLPCLVHAKPRDEQHAGRRPESHPPAKPD